MPSFPPDFPPEILARILVHLPYQDLLRGLRVVKQWKALIESYPALRVETFKKASAVYVEKEDGSPGDNTEAGSEKIRMHPVLKDISFGLGDDVSGVTIYHRNGSEIALSDTGVADDLATIPAVHEFTITIEEDLDEFFEFQVEVQNSAGVTVIDIFTQLANTGQRIVETQEGPMSMSEAFIDHIIYEGFAVLKRTGTTLSAHLLLGS